MALLILGVALWAFAHFFKRLFPAKRAEIGDKAKGGVALALLASIVAMVIGYRGAEFIPVYTPIPGIGHLNNLLMIPAIFLMGAGSAKGVVASKIRHPMLSGVTVWAVAHLLVNGDVASIILFGGLGLWSLVQMYLINRAEGAWSRPVAGPISKDVRVLIVTFVLYAVIAFIHNWLGYSPFQGTYG
ncbi:NnrU family protein [Falsihalocynthiibacter sp. SS001]|uniref:NnrU family protein n=1 Tax=Falsihalocynthiibacter sp. SS001 TaxID=3349698 RepID=UPI0036D427CB